MNNWTREDIDTMELIMAKPEPQITDNEIDFLIRVCWQWENEQAMTKLLAAEFATKNNLTHLPVVIPEHNLDLLMYHAVRHLSGRDVSLKIGETDEGMKAYAWYSPSRGKFEIVIRPDVAAKHGTLLNVLCHEAAHVKRHADILMSDEGPDETLKHRMELEADWQAEKWERYAEAEAHHWATKGDTMAEAKLKAELLALVDIAETSHLLR